MVFKVSQEFPTASLDITKQAMGLPALSQTNGWSSVQFKIKY